MLGKQRKEKGFKKAASVILSSILTVSLLSGVTVSANKGIPGGENSTEQFGVNNYDNQNAIGTPSIVKFDFLNSGAYGEIAATGEAAPHAYAAKVKAVSDGTKTRAQFYSPFHENAHYTAKEMNYKIGFKFKPTSTDVKYRIAFQNNKDIEGVRQDGTVDSWAKNNRNFFTIELDCDGKMNYFTGGKYNYTEKEGEWIKTDVSYYSDRWNDFEAIVDRENGKMYAYVNGIYFGTVDYKTFWQNIYPGRTLQNCDGLIAMATITNGNGDGWYNTANITDSSKLDDEYIYIDDLRYDYISSGFYATASLNDNGITVQFSKTPAALNVENIRVYTSDGEEAAHGEIMVEGDNRTVDIPMTNLKDATEYVIKLSEGMRTVQGEELYTPYVYITTPTAQREYIINENFDSAYGNNTGEKMPVNTVSSARTTGNYISSVNKTDDANQTTATNDDGNGTESGKVLKIAEGDAANQNTGIAFNLPKKVSDSFSVEFDLYEKDITRVENAGDASWGWRLQMSAGRVYSQNDWQRLLGLDETRTYAQNAYDVFGTSTNKMVGMPYLYNSGWKSSPNAATAETDASDENRVADTQNKWNHYKLDVRLGDVHSDMVMHAYVNGADIGEWKLPYQMANGAFVSKPQVGSIVFVRERSGDYLTEKTEFYLDNVQVYTTAKPDSKIETADIINVENNENFGAVSIVGDTAKSIKVKFSDAVTDILDEDHTNYTYTDKFSLTNSSGENIDFALGEFDADDKSITLTLTDFLPIGETVMLSVKSGLYDVVAAESGSKDTMIIGKYNVLAGYTARINVTQNGELKISDLKLTKDGDTYKLSGNVKNTTGKPTDFNAIIAGFGDTGMTDLKIEKITQQNGTYEQEKEFVNITAGTNTKTLKGLAWDSMNLIKPLCDAAKTDSASSDQ